MIKDPPMLRIRRDFQRPPIDLVRVFAGAMTGHVIDAQGGSGALDWRIKPLRTEPLGFCGVAVTCDCGPADNLALFAALDVAKPGDVIMAATGGHMGCAVTGDLLVGLARNCGVAAIVTDGAVRDVSGILGVGLPVCCVGVSANSPVRNGPGTVGLPIVIGGVAVASGDVIVGDADGVVVIPIQRAGIVARQLADVRSAEASLETKVKDGLRIPDFIAQLLLSDRVENLD